MNYLFERERKSGDSNWNCSRNKTSGIALLKCVRSFKDILFMICGS